MTNPSEAAGEVGASDQGIHSESANGKQFDTYDYDMMMNLLEQLNE